jgi:hypothetical protein
MEPTVGDSRQLAERGIGIRGDRALPGTDSVY